MSGAGGRLHRRRRERPDLDLAQRHEALARIHVEAGQGAEEGLQVGMLRAAEDVVDGARLHDLAMVDHNHLVGHVRHHAEVVRDEEDGHAEVPLQLLHELQDLGLDGDVERRGRLVGDKERRAADERHGQHRALAQPAREFERILVAGRSGSRKPTLPSISTTAPRTSSAATGLCSCSASPIWSPMRWTGESEDIGSWKIMPIRPPRSACISGPIRGSAAMSIAFSGASGSRKVIEPPRMSPVRAGCP